MSKWIEINDPEDIEISKDRKSIYICIGHDMDGNIWVEVPIDAVKNLLKSIE